MTKHTEIWANGYDSYKDGVYWNANPYALSTAGYTEWQQGWLAAEADAGEAQDDAYYTYEEPFNEFYDYEPSPYDGTYSEM